jgi:tetratricopeptide (TPR) repeat protein
MTRLLTEARELDLARGDRLSAAWAVNELGMGLMNNRRDQEVDQLLAEQVPPFEDLWPDPVTVDLKILMARARNAAGDYPGALALAEEVLIQSERANDVRRIAAGLTVKGTVIATLSRLREGIALLEAAEKLTREAGDQDLLSSVLLLTGFFLNETDAQAALVKYREGYDLAKRRGNRPQMLILANNIVYTAYLTGDWDGGLEVASASIAEVLERGHRMWLLGNTITIKASRGDDVAALLKELNELANEGDHADLRIPVLDAVGAAHLAAGELEQALSSWRLIADMDNADPAQKPTSYYQAARPALWMGDLQRAVQQLSDLDATGVHGAVVEARRLTVRAGIAALEGRRSDSETLYRDAIRSWHELGMTWEEAMTGLDQVLLSASDELDGRLVDEARERLAALGAKPFVERLEQHVAAWKGPRAQARAPSRNEAHDEVRAAEPA